MQLISLNVKDELQSKKNKAVLYHADISKRYSSVCHLKIVFYFLHKLKQRSRSSDVTGRHYWPVDSDVTEGVITTRSNRLKFRLATVELGHRVKSMFSMNIHRNYQRHLTRVLIVFVQKRQAILNKGFVLL